MISFPHDSLPDEYGRDGAARLEGAARRDSSGEPRAVGQLMAAVLARYGISANADPMPPCLPHLEHRSAEVGEMQSVG
jgi:hypothetical protein